MNGFRSSSLVLILMLAVCCVGCGELKSVDDALAIIDTKPSKTERAERFLHKLGEDERQRLGLELFLSDSPARGHVGIRLLASTAISGETWQKIESQTAVPHIARRFTILSSKVRRTQSVATIISFLDSSPQGDFIVHTSALYELTGLLFGPEGTSCKLVAARWERYLLRHVRGMPIIVSQALAGSYTAKDADSALRAFRSIPVSMLGTIADDILDITTNVYPEVGREAALLLGDSTDDASVRLIFVLLDSEDYLTRYNAYNSLLKRTGMSFTYDPSLNAMERKKAIESMRRMLGILE